MKIKGNQIKQAHIAQIKDKKILKAIESCMENAEKELDTRKYERTSKILFIFSVICLFLFIILAVSFIKAFAPEVESLRESCISCY